MSTPKAEHLGVPAPTASGEDPDIERFLHRHRELEVDKYFRALVKLEGSDLHMKVGRPPMVRVRNELRPLNRPPIDDEEMTRLLVPMMNERNRRIFEEDGGADFAHTCEVDGIIWRFRVNLLRQLGHMGLVARRVNNKIPDFRGLYLPDSIENLCNYDQGMVLLAGVTGSGKSTTIASMLNYINARERVHILTLEDPIEFVFTEDKALINQREIGMDVKDFGIGMKHAVREDPDVILVGEIRDALTMEIALMAADTGHLVLSTLHTVDAPQTINRVISFFPPHQHQEIRYLLAATLQAVVAQRLVPIKDTKGRVPAVEVMIVTSAIREYIIDPEKTPLIQQAIREGVTAHGMQSFDQHLLALYQKEQISGTEALRWATNPEALSTAMRGIKFLKGI